MSSHLQIHLGPYMVVKNKTVDTFKTIKVCSTSSCQKRDKEINSKFCSDCGVKPEKRELPIKKVITFGEFFQEEWCNELYLPHCGGDDMFKHQVVAIPNTIKGRPLKYGIDAENCDAYNIPLDKIEADKIWFRAKCEAMIDVALEEFGEENVSFEWGIVTHFM